METEADFTRRMINLANDEKQGSLFIKDCNAMIEKKAETILTNEPRDVPTILKELRANLNIDNNPVPEIIYAWRRKQWKQQQR